MPQDKLQSVKDKYNGPTIGPMNLLQQFQYEGNRPEWLNRAIEIASHVGSLMGMDEPSGGLGNINLAGDLIPFASKSKGIWDELGDITTKLHSSLEKHGLITAANKETVLGAIRTDPSWLESITPKNPELAALSKKYRELNDLANSQLKNDMILNKLGLPNETFKSSFKPVPSEIPPDTSKVVPFNTKETQGAIKGLKNSIVDYIGYGDTPHITYDELKNHFIGYNDWVTEDHIKDAITKGIKEGRLAKTPEGLRLTSGLPTPPSSNIK